MNPSEHLLRRAFAWFRDRIREYCGDDGEAVARFVDTAVDKLFLTVITVTDELNAFTVFETLNARGVRLSATDLLKNYLFSLISRESAHESEIRTLENRWEDIVGFLGSESFPEFLRIFWNSRNRLVRKFELFKTIRGQVRDKAGAFALIRDMDRHARVYAALRSPEDDAWTMQERDSLAQLQMFNVRQPLAVLLAAFDRFEQEGQNRIRALPSGDSGSVFSLQRDMRPSKQQQEMLYNDIARGLSTGRIAGVAEAIGTLRPVYPSDGEFRTAFADKTLRTTSHRNKKVVRFILFRIEKHLSGGSLDFESARYGIEHVLPENPGAGWEQFDDRQRDAFTYRLGNLTLLRTTANRDLGNAGFDEKRPVFQSERIPDHQQARTRL